MATEFNVVQVEENRSTVWCTTDDYATLCKFCQHHIDSAYDGSLKDFYVVWSNGLKGKSIPFYQFCEKQGIRKRSFEERIATQSR